MSNVFESYGDAATAAPVRRKEAIAVRRAEKTEAKRAMAALDETAILMKGYRVWLRERLAKLHEGPFGAEIKGLESFLRAMTPASAGDLIEFFRQASWMRRADSNTRFEILDLVSRAITRVRVNAGHTPFDDPMPDEPNNAFLDIKEMLAC